MKTVRLIASILLLGVLVTQQSSANHPALAYSNTNLIDDAVFDNTNSLNEAQIQSYLTGPCLSSYQSETPHLSFDSSGNAMWSYGPDTSSAAHIIYLVSRQWGINPQVLIATLQKEESLITGTSCDDWRYNSAMGYGCPDSGGCNAKYAGFTRQVLWGGWQLKFNKERSIGNTAWDGDDDIVYGGFMTKGTYKRCGSASCAANFYDGNATIDGQVINLEDGATASLYTYTPHLNQRFPSIFETFFGAGSTSAYPANAIFRSANPATGEHFYTSSSTEWLYTGTIGFRQEGIAFTDVPSATSEPVMRLSKPDGKHFYTMSQDEANFAVSQYGFKLEGVAFTAEPNPGPGLTPVYRLRNGHNGDYLYTSSDAESAAAVASSGYILDGVAWYSNQ